MKALPCLVCVLSVAACSGTSSGGDASTGLAVTVAGSNIGAVVVRITGPAPGTFTAAASVSAQTDTTDGGLTLVAFADQLSGVIGQFSSTTSAAQYHATVLEAASTGNAVIDPSTVTVILKAAPAK
ncbi:MAG TPA: hypothetical protein VGM77_05805 [Gemmatimonadales bacterium]|jgi:hypothetical protein